MNRRFALTIVLVAFVFMLVAASPAPMGVAGQTQEAEYSANSNFATASEGNMVWNEHGSTIDWGNGSFTYTTSIGESNIWNGSAYVPYIWNDASKVVSYAGATMEFYDWYIVLKNATHTLVDDGRWQVEYKDKQDNWRFLDLWSHSWLPTIQNESNMTFGQSYTDGSSKMNVTYTFRNNDEVKIAIDFVPQNAGTYRFVWQTTGIMSTPTFIKDKNNYTTGALFDELNIVWNDVVDNNNLNATYDWVVANKKLDVFFGDIVLEADEDYYLDPTYSMAADSDDTEWHGDIGFANNHNTQITNEVASYYDVLRRAWFRWSMTIPADSAINDADLNYFVVYAYEAGQQAKLRRSTEINLQSLEADGSEPATTSTGEVTFPWPAAGWRSLDCDALVQALVDDVAWDSGDYGGFWMFDDSGNADGNAVEDYQKSTSNHAFMVVDYTAPNTAPVNDATPVCTNMDDTDNLYARYKLYEFSVSTTDAQGYADIDYIELSSYNYGTTTLRWRVRYDEDTNVFSEISGATYIGLTGSTYSKSGNNMDVTFKLYIEWAHGNWADDDLYQYVRDGPGLSDSDAYNSNYDYETRLDLSTFSLNDGSGTADRGDIAGSVTASGTVIYYGSGNNYPASSQVDVWIHCADVSTSPWSDTTLVSGAFSKVVMSDDVEGLDTYSFKVVLEGAGAWATDQLHATHSDTYIADSLVVTFVEDTTTPPGGTAVNIDVTVTYVYDSGAVSSWTMMVTRDAVNWLTKTADFADTNVKGTDYIYSCSSVGDVGAHGITAFTPTASNEVVWQNSVPVNDATPTCTNLDDTDNLYGRYKLYEFSVSTTDADGYADINYIELRLYDYGTTTLRWTVRYTESTNAFTEESGASYIELTGSTYNKDGSNLDVTFKLYIEWAHGDWTDDDLYQYVIDGSSITDTDSYDSNYDYETRLDFLAYSLDDGDGTPDRGTYYEDDSITASGTVIYFGSGDNYPASGEVDVWVHCVDVTFSPWSDTTLTSGVFSMTVDSDEAVGLDSYWFKVLAEGTGPWGADLCHVVHWDTYIADRLDVLLEEDTTTPFGGQSVSIDVTVTYAYDGTPVGSWSIMVTRDGANWLTKTADFTDTNIKGVDYVYSATAPVYDVGGHGVDTYQSTASNEVVWQNNVPVNDVTPTIDNPDDTDNLYARYKWYYVAINVSDADGYADIDFAQIYIYLNDRSTYSFVLRFDEDTNTFSEVDGVSYVELDVGTSSYAKSGNDLDITFVFKIEWAHADLTDTDTRSYVIDVSVTSDSDYYETNWDIETRLDFTTFSLSDGIEVVDRGNYNTLDGITASGTVIYYGSGDNYVPSDEVDVWVSCGDVAGSPWSDLTLVSGAFSMTVDSDDVVGLDTYTFIVVIEGAGSSGANQLNEAHTDTYIADRLKFLTIAIVNIDGTDVTHGEVDVGEEVQVRITAELEYDNHVIGSGDTLFLSAAPDLYGSSVWFELTWDAGNNWWEGNKTESGNVNLWLFSAHSHDANEATYGITAVNTNSISDWTIWDRIQLTNIYVSDGHVNANSNSTVWITCEMEYWLEKGGTEWVRDFNGDNMYLNGSLMTYDDEDRWYIDTLTYASGNRSFIVSSGFWNLWDITTLENATSVYICWDRVEVTALSINRQWTVIGYNVTMTWTADYEISSETWSGTIAWNGTAGTRFPVESTAGNYTFSPTSATDAANGITVVFASANLVWCIFDDATVSSTAYYWVQYSVNSVWLIWMSGTWTWTINGTTLDTGTDELCKIRSHMNATDDDWAIVNGAGDIGDLIIGEFDTSWYHVNLTINCETTIDGVAYDWQVWEAVFAVDILHSLQITNFNIEPTDDYFWITFQTNLLNASITIWDDAINSGALFENNTYYSNAEGMHQIPRSEIEGLHNLTFCITSTGISYDKDFTIHDYVWWYNITYVVAEPEAYDCHIVILDSLYNLVPFDTFEVYKNGTRIYHDIIRVSNGYTYNITIKNRYGDYVNTTAVFEADAEMVVFVNIYSLKFWSAYEGICVLTISRGGVNYSEVLMPMEIVNFRLYRENYTYSIDYLDDVIMTGSINLLASTGVVITNDTISDIFGLIDAVWDMGNDINITVNTVADNTYLIQLMFDWTNTTLYNQSITILASFNWDNTTLYNQTISLLSAFNATNTVIYDQIILIQNMFSWENTTLYNQTISILNAFNATNTVIYAQTISILSEISTMNATIYGQTVSLLNYLYYDSSSIYNQTVNMISTLSLIGSNVTANYISVSASLLAIDSSLLANFTSVTAALTLIDSNLLSNFTAVTATLSAIGSNVTANYLSVAATLSLMNSNLLSNFTAVTSTLSAIGSNITTKFLSIAATLSLIDSNLLSNFTAVTATLSAIGTNITSNYLSVAASLTLIDSNLLSNFTAVSATLSAIDSSLLSNFTSITADLLLINSTLVSNFTSIVASLSAIDSNITANYLLLASDLDFLNATMYLIDDPANLNPLILGSKLSDDYCDFTVVTNWHNSSISIYDNDELQSGPLSELLSPIRYPLSDTAGTHNLSVFIDAGADSFWYNISYTVAETAFRVDSGPYTETDTRNYFSGYANIGFNYSVYDNNSLSTSGTKSFGSFSIDWSKSTLKGLHEWGILFNSSGTLRWVNGSYGADGLLILNLWPGQDNDSIYLSGRLYSTDLTLSYWVWENTGSGNVLVGSGDISIVASTAWFTVYWDKSAENVAANWTLTITDGLNNSTAYGWYTKLDSAVTNITNNASHYEDRSTYMDDPVIVEGDLYDGPSPEAAMWQSFGYIGLVFGMTFLVGMVYYAARGMKGRRKKRDRANDFLVTRR